MATSYLMYGGTAADAFILVDSATGFIKPGAVGTATVWTAVPANGGGTQITDLLTETGSTAVIVTADSYGNFRFQAPTGLGELYVDPGLSSGERYAVNPIALATRVLTLETTGGPEGISLQSQVNTLSGSITQLQQQVAALGGSFIVVPTAPTITSVVAGNGAAVVNFNPPASNGNSPITSYTAKSTPGGFIGTTTNVTAGTLTVAGLTNGTAYTFTLTASNLLGAGAASSTSLPVTPLSPNSPIVSLTAPTITPSSVGLAWTVANGSIVTSWLVTRTASAGGTAPTPITLAANATSYSFTGLAASTAYTFSLTPITTSGSGTASTVAATTLAAVTSLLPGNVTATAGPSAGQATLSWTAPAGVTVASYNVARSGVDTNGNTYAGTVASTVLTKTFTALVVGDVYTLSVGAVIGTTAGANVSVQVLIPDTGAPGQPVINSTDVSTPNQVTVAYSDATAGASAILGWNIYLDGSTTPL